MRVVPPLLLRCKRPREGSAPVWFLTPSVYGVGESVLRAGRVLPGLEGVPYEAVRLDEAVRLGVRAMPVDGVPIVGPYPGLASLYVVCSHSGVTLGPLLGRIVADEIVRSKVDERIMPFRPERLLAG
jgi:glycine/D-amino acid oxidase-like deaminating enzyme